MGITDTPTAERPRIAFFGTCNAGKSSLVNAVTGQDLSVVSEVAGTTTDVVEKSMELLPLGPVVIVDTPGIDDADQGLGAQRVQRARKVLDGCSIAVLVVDGLKGMTTADQELVTLFKERDTPFVIAWSKCDLEGEEPLPESLRVSAVTGEGVHALKERLAAFAQASAASRPIIGDLISAGDLVVLVTPIDESAPKGRLILPQQLVLRECLDLHACPICCQAEELSDLLTKLAFPPALVITDSQAFAQVAPLVPESIPFTSFSLAMARYKGTLQASLAAVDAMGKLTDDSLVLICEGCTHHRQCKDIGTVKMPEWIRSHCAANPRFAFASGKDFPSLDDVDLVVHCGGCMLSREEVAARAKAAAEAGVPLLNYGMAIAQVTGVLERALRPLMG